MSNQNNAKRKYDYSHQQKQKKMRYLSIENGMTGFLCTCNFREKECIRDSYRLLEEFLPEDFPGKTVAEKPSEVEAPEEQKADDKNEEKEEEKEEDISEMLNREIQELNDQSKKPLAKPFQYIDTGVKNVIFMRSTLQNPLDIILKIVKEIVETKKQRSRYILRCLPVQLICKAAVSDIKTKAEDLIGKFFTDDAKTFSVIFNRRYNNTIDRTEVIDALAGIIQQKNPGNKADLKNPQMSVVVEIIKNQCFLSVVPDYFKYKKYNLLELSCSVSSSEETTDEKPEEKLSEA